MGHGGRRPGAGKPKGTKQQLAYGEVKALKAMRRGLPADVTDDEKALVEACRQRQLDVMLGLVDFQQSAVVLKAATRLSDEVCGPLANKLEHTGKDGSPLTVSININRGPKPEGA